MSNIWSIVVTVSQIGDTPQLFMLWRTMFFNSNHIFSNLEKLIMPAKLEISFNFTAYWRPGVRAETLAFDIIAVRGEKFSSKQSTMQA